MLYKTLLKLKEKNGLTDDLKTKIDVFYADTVPLARENPHKIFPAVFAGFSPNDHTA